MAKRGRPKGSKKKRKYTKRMGAQVTEDASLTVENIIKEIRELKQAYINNLLAIRKELIKSRRDVKDLKETKDLLLEETL